MASANHEINTAQTRQKRSEIQNYAVPRIARLFPKSDKTWTLGHTKSFFFGGGLTSRRISEVNDISKSYELIHDLSDYVSLSKKLTPKLPP